MLYISIVSHNNKDELFRLLKQFSEFQFDRKIVKFIVTSNTREKLDFKNFFDFEITYIKNTTKKGFAENHNQAFQICCEKGATYFLVLNPDVEIIEFDVKNIIRFIQDIGIKGIFYPRNVSVEQLRKQLNTRLPGPRIVAHYLGKFQKIEWISGEAMLFDVEWYRELRGFDQSYFLYVEDVDICNRNLRAGGVLQFVPQFTIKHRGARKSKRNVNHLFMHLSSLVRFYKSLFLERKC